MRKWKDPTACESETVFVQFEYAPDFFRPIHPDTPEWDVDFLKTRSAFKNDGRQTGRRGGHGSKGSSSILQEKTLERADRRTQRNSRGMEEALRKRRRVCEVLNRMASRVERSEEEYRKAEGELERTATELKNFDQNSAEDTKEVAQNEKSSP